MLTTTPYDDKAEKAVIGSIIIDHLRVMGICTERGLTADWFQKQAHRLVYMHLYGMKDVDLTLLGNSLKASGELELAGGYAALEEFVDSTPTSAHAEYYIEILETNYRLKMIALYATEAAQRASAGLEASEIISDLSANITSITASPDGQTTADAMDDNITVLENAFNGITSGLPLPWEGLTSITGGAQIGAVIPLVGRDGKGKSGALAQILDYWAGINVPTLVFSLEDVKRRVLLRMGGNRERYSARTVETGKTLFYGRPAQITEYDRDTLRGKMLNYKAFIEAAPVWIFDEPHTVEQICDRIRHYKRTRNIKAVTIDGFKDIIFTRGKTTNEAQSHISQRLCAIAKECEVAIIVVSHIRKTDDNAPISKQDITGASAQFQGARQVFIFQDAGIDGIDGNETFLLDCCKSNFTSGAEVRLRRDPLILTYTETE